MPSGRPARTSWARSTSRAPRKSAGIAAVSCAPSRRRRSRRWCAQAPPCPRRRLPSSAHRRRRRLFRTAPTGGTPARGRRRSGRWLNWARRNAQSPGPIPHAGPRYRPPARRRPAARPPIARHRRRSPQTPARERTLPLSGPLLEAICLALGHPLLEIVDRCSSAQERLVVQQLLMQRDVGLDALDDHLRQGDAHAGNRLLPRIPVRDDLADQRVVIRWNEIVVIDVGIDPNPRPARRVIGRDSPRRRHESVGVLGVDAAFDRVSVAHNVALSKSESLPRRDANLLLHNIDAGDHLRYRVLHLHPRIHLDEKKLVVLVEKLERTRTTVV